MQYDTNTESRRGKLLILNQKPITFTKTDVSYMNLFPKNTTHIFGFWASQVFKVSRSTCFRVVDSSFVANSFVVKPEIVTLSKM